MRRFSFKLIGSLSILFIIIPAFTFMKKSGPFTYAREPELNVLHYTLVLDITDIQGMIIQGYADLQIIPVKNPVSEIRLDLLALHVDSVWIDEVPVSGFVSDGRFLRIPLETPLQAGQNILVSVFYHGRPAMDPAWGGFYFDGPHAYSMGVGMGSDPHPYGRCWFPCQDNFTDRATYDYFITVSAGNTAVCPGDLVEIITNNDGTKTYYWTMKQNIPTYLSSVAVAPYVCLQDTLRGRLAEIPAMVYILPEDSTTAAAAFRNLGQWLGAFEDMFGPYRWSKTGFVAVPFSGGAMEHATAISFAQSTLEGDRSFEDLYIHEFAHSWFGNLVTCATAADMWLNEGWASYCVALFYEFTQGKEAFKSYVRKNHLNVLQRTSVQDGNIAVYGVSREKTYSSTVYNKGFDAAHTIRNQISDADFFPAVKQYFEKYAFQSITTEEFKDFFNMATQKTLDDVFNFWVYDKGFTHFSVDSFSCKKIEKEYEVQIFTRQRIKEANGYSYHTSIDMQFMDHSWRSVVKSFDVSGQNTILNMRLPFKPCLVLADPEEKIADATIDEYKIIRFPGEYMFTCPYFNLNVFALEDSLFLRITKNFISPDTSFGLAKGYWLDQTGYWTVEGIFPESFECEGSFFYEGFKYTGNDFINDLKEKGLLNDLKLVYRSGPGNIWKEIPSVMTGTESADALSTKQIQNGEYCLAVFR